MLTKKNSLGIFPSKRAMVAAMLLTGAIVCGARDAQAQDEEVPYRRYNTNMMAGGIVSISVGATLSTIGALMLTNHSAPDPCLPEECSTSDDWSSLGDSYGQALDKDFTIYGATLIGLGVLTIGVGIPVTIIGAKKVPVNRNAFTTTDSIFIEPTSNGVRLRF